MERSVGSIRSECLDRVLIRRALDLEPPSKGLCVIRRSRLAAARSPRPWSALLAATTFV
jgi:hypothetical protein